MFSPSEPAPASLDRDRAGSRWRALERGRGGLLDKLPLTVDDAPEERKDERLRCRGCGHAIASEQDRISVQGNHQHYRVNPHDVNFLFGCFRQAPGGTEIGEATLEHTWFAGYRWRIVLCGQCGTHLGWGFHSQDRHRFCGLILNRLIEPR